MITREELQASWNGIKDKLKERWSQINESEWREASNSFDQLVGLIHRKTGEAKSQIEGFLDRLVNHSEANQSDAGKLTDPALDYASQASAALQVFKDRMNQAMREQLAQTEEIVRRRPTESLLVAAGTGLVVGVILGCLTRSR